MTSQQQNTWQPFAEFAASVKASGGLNRFPGPEGNETKSYSVYLDGKFAEGLPQQVREQEFRDVTLQALTEKVGLDQNSFRDCLRVAELVAIRQAWMVGTLEHSKDQEAAQLMSAEQNKRINADFGILAAGLDHPWIQTQLLQQQRQSREFKAMLEGVEPEKRAAAADRAPEEITRGRVVSQTADFTMQATATGEFVTHENRRLGSLPEIGKDVTVTYYRGSGQVFDNDKNLTVGDPYIDTETQDLAVRVSSKEGELKQVILFKGVAAFAKFVEEQGLPEALAEKAIETRIQNPKVIPSAEKSDRENVTGIYIDPRSGALAIDYREKDARNTILFGSAKALEDNAKAFGIEKSQIAEAYALEAAQSNRSVDKTITADVVKTHGPGSRMDQARMYAERTFGANAAAKREFLERVQRTEQPDASKQLQEKPSSRDDDLER